PNFMVKSVADSNGVEMPAFGMYIVRSFEYLVPVLVAMAAIFIAQSTIGYLIGAACVAFVFGRILYYLRSEHRIRTGKKVVTHIQER
ncbi:MAG: sodium:proton antiporter, partial [Arcanobacterium sp.]|nr:sodium:proton antiporter [Arcanobacterium sp.]